MNMLLCASCTVHHTTAEPRPGPAEYHVGEADLCSPPKYSCRQQCKPVFPDILLYPEHSIMELSSCETILFQWYAILLLQVLLMCLPQGTMSQDITLLRIPQPNLPLVCPCPRDQVCMPRLYDKYMFKYKILLSPQLCRYQSRAQSVQCEATLTLHCPYPSLFFHCQAASHIRNTT